MKKEIPPAVLIGVLAVVAVIIIIIGVKVFVHQPEKARPPSVVMGEMQKYYGGGRNVAGAKGTNAPPPAKQ